MNEKRIRQDCSTLPRRTDQGLVLNHIDMVAQLLQRVDRPHRTIRRVQHQHRILADLFGEGPCYLNQTCLPASALQISLTFFLKKNIWPLRVEAEASEGKKERGMGE